MKGCSAFLSFINSHHYPFVPKMKEEGFQRPGTSLKVLKWQDRVSSIKRLALPKRTQSAWRIEHSVKSIEKKIFPTAFRAEGLPKTNNQAFGGQTCLRDNSTFGR
jgi:hypothetical protein